jgi:replicative DNA helicase
MDEFVVTHNTQLKCYMAIRAALTSHDVTGDVNRVAFFSLEMEKRELSKRWLVYLSRVDYNQEHASPDDHRRMAEAFEQLKGLQDRIFVSPPAASSTLDQIIRGLRWYKDRNDIAIAYVDYAQLINVPGSSDSSRYDQMAQVARRLKLAAQELDIPVVLGVQLNREAVSKSPGGRPGVHHIADSLDLLRSADVATMIWNPARYLAGQQVATWDGKVVLLTPKIRHRATPPPFVYGYEQVFTTFKMLNPALEQELRGQLSKIGETANRSSKP